MRRFFLAHLFEHSCRRRIRFAQLVRKFAENPSIFFFVLNRKRQDFALAQILEFLQHSFPLRVLPRRKNRTTPPSKSSQRPPRRCPVQFRFVFRHRALSFRTSLRTPPRCQVPLRFVSVHQGAPFQSSPHLAVIPEPLAHHHPTVIPNLAVFARFGICFCF